MRDILHTNCSGGSPTSPLVLSPFQVSPTSSPASPSLDPGQEPTYLSRVPRKGMAGKESETAEIPVI